MWHAYGNHKCIQNLTRISKWNIHTEHVDLDRTVILKNLREHFMLRRTRDIWLSIGCRGVLLLIRQWTTWFFKRRYVSLPAGRLPVSQERPCSMESVIHATLSSGSIVSDYGLDDRAIGVRSLVGAKDFSSSLCVQTGSGAHPASCTMGTGGPFPGGKSAPGRDADHSPHLVPRSRMSRSYSSSPPKRLHGV
jgi:hypothetical protein